MAVASTPGTEAELKAFLEAAGRSLADAQGALGGLKTELVLANAELEAKVALKAGAGGTLTVQPISAGDLRLAQFNAAGVSTLRVNFVATAGETLSAPPTRQPGDIIDDVRKRPDVAILEGILGPLVINTTYVADAQRWLVTARDASGRLVRETIVPDAAP